MPHAVLIRVQNSLLFTLCSTPISLHHSCTPVLSPTSTRTRSHHPSPIAFLPSYGPHVPHSHHHCLLLVCTLFCIGLNDGTTSTRSGPLCTLSRLVSPPPPPFTLRPYHPRSRSCNTHTLTCRLHGRTSPSGRRAPTESLQLEARSPNRHLCPAAQRAPGHQPVPDHHSGIPSLPRQVVRDNSTRLTPLLSDPSLKATP